MSTAATDSAWTDLVWTDLMGRAHVARARTELAEHGISIRRADAAAGYDGPADQTGRVLAVPDWSSRRRSPWQDDVQVVLADLRESDGSASDLCSRSVLRRVLGTLATEGYQARAAAELEFFLLDTATGGPLYADINQYSITKGAELEPLVAMMCDHLATLDVPVEATNPEYAGGQLEVNVEYCEALAAADRAVLVRYTARRVARDHGLDATFLAKPWTDNAGSGMHVHQSLWREGRNVMHEAGALSELGRSYVAGLLAHMRGLALLGSHTPNAYHRRADYSFAPTIVCWGADNRTLAVRAITGSASATRVEQRDAAADCNVYLAFAGQFAAGHRGVTSTSVPPEPVTGNAYERRDLPPLPLTFPEALAEFDRSPLAADVLGGLLSHWRQVMERERQVLITSCSDWERARYLAAV